MVRNISKGDRDAPFWPKLLARSRAASAQAINPNFCRCSWSHQSYLRWEERSRSFPTLLLWGNVFDRLREDCDQYYGCRYHGNKKTNSDIGRTEWLHKILPSVLLAGIHPLCCAGECNYSCKPSSEHGVHSHSRFIVCCRVKPSGAMHMDLSALRGALISTCRTQHTARSCSLRCCFSPPGIWQHKIRWRESHQPAQQLPQFLRVPHVTLQVPGPYCCSWSSPGKADRKRSASASHCPFILLACSCQDIEWSGAGVVGRDNCSNDFRMLLQHF